MSGILNLLLSIKTVIITVADAYFNYVFLLLNTISTNGAQNGTFLDSSSNNFTITRSGNTNQGTFSPFSQTGWSNYFGGSGNYAVSNAAVITATTTTFTIEGWINPTIAAVSGSSVPSVIGDMQSTGATNYWSFGPIASGAVVFYWYDGAAKSATTSGTINLTQWNHIAISVSANAISIYINGTRQTLTGTTTLTNRTGTTSTVAFSQYNTTTSVYVGYVSNFSVLSGTAKYSGATITVPTAPLSTSTTNQTVLFGANNSLTDANTATTAKVFTLTGTPLVQSFSPFAPAAAYSTSTVGGSGYFDSVQNDLLSVASNAAFNFGTGDFTVEFWFYALAPAADSRFISNAAYNASGIDISWESGSNRITWYIGATPYVIPLPSRYAWHHVAFARTGTTFNTYIDGARANTYTSVSANITSATSLYIGNYYNIIFSNYINAYISNVRLLKGTALYTGATYTVPTAPLTNITNTSLLLNFTNAGIYDSTSKNDMDVFGTAQVSTSQVRFGFPTISFNGSSDYLVYLYKSAADPNITLASSFTVELWLYLNSASAIQSIMNTRGSSATAGWEFRVNADGTLQFYNTAGSSVTTTAILTSGTWYYIAAVKNAGNLNIYVNGVDGGGSAAFGSAAATTNPLTIGARNGATFLGGNIYNLRLTRGIARTVTTVPTAPFALQ